MKTNTLVILLAVVAVVGIIIYMVAQKDNKNITVNVADDDKGNSGGHSWSSDLVNIGGAVGSLGDAFSKVYGTITGNTNTAQAASDENKASFDGGYKIKVW